MTLLDSLEPRILNPELSWLKKEMEKWHTPVPGGRITWARGICDPTAYMTPAYNQVSEPDDSKEEQRNFDWLCFFKIVFSDISGGPESKIISAGGVRMLCPGCDSFYLFPYDIHPDIHGACEWAPTAHSEFPFTTS